MKSKFELGLFQDIGIDENNVDVLRWRHWIVAFSINYVFEFRKANGDMNFIECGVGDGMSALFAFKEIDEYIKANPNTRHMMHLYDSWEILRIPDMTEKESLIKGRYIGNSLERTKKNLEEFKESTCYHVGYIPESLLHEPIFEGHLDYLYLDMNSSAATPGAMEYFYPKMQRVVSYCLMIMDGMDLKTRKEL